MGGFGYILPFVASYLFFQQNILKSNEISTKNVEMLEKCIKNSLTTQKYVVCALGIAKSVTAATIAEAVALAQVVQSDPD